MVLSVLIPIYNEKNTILEILKRIDAVDLGGIFFKKEIILVDDGSSDGTREILKGLENKYKIIYHSKNQGKGAAIITGLEHVSGEYVIIQDADLEYDPEDYKKLLEVALKNNAEVVYGSRKLKPQNKYSHLSFYLGGLLLTWLTKIFYGIEITDESTCYKLFKTETIKAIPLKCKRFEFCPEITAKIAKRKIKIYEVPISYFPRHKKEGKKIKWGDGIEAAWVLIKNKFVD
jgi:glycosyltransferase involved in cell wall biosynthesis